MTESFSTELHELNEALLDEAYADSIVDGQNFPPELVDLCDWAIDTARSLSYSFAEDLLHAYGVNGWAAVNRLLITAVVASPEPQSELEQRCLFSV